jgi:Domain of unknown function (DUF4386)
MDSDRQTAIIVGVLFILATAASLASTVLTASTTSSDYLTSAAANANQVKAGAILELVAAGSVALIPAFLFPVLRRYDERMALGYLAIRILEAFVLVLSAVCALLILTLSQKYVGATSPVDPSFATSGAVLQGLASWTFVLDPIVFGAGALLFYYVLFRSRLLPIWLSAWGLFGAALVVAAGLAGMFGTFQYVLAVPIAVQEMALAVWLILKGFRRIETGTRRAVVDGTGT